MKNCSDHGFQTFIFDILLGSRVSSCSIWKLFGSRVSLNQNDTSKRGALSKKSCLFFTEKSVFESSLTFCIFYFFFKELSFLFPNIMRRLFFIIDIKIKNLIFFSLKITPFSQKRCALWWDNKITIIHILTY